MINLTSELPVNACLLASVYMYALGRRIAQHQSTDPLFTYAN